MVQGWFCSSVSRFHLIPGHGGCAPALLLPLAAPCPCPHLLGTASLPKALTEAGAAFCSSAPWLAPGYPLFPHPLLVPGSGRRRAWEAEPVPDVREGFSANRNIDRSGCVFKCAFFTFARSPWTLFPPAAPLAFISFESSKQILSLHLLHLWE